MKHFSITCEVWVKPLFKKQRPKIITTTWAAESYEQMLCLVRESYANKRWTLLDWREIPELPGAL